MRNSSAELKEKARELGFQSCGVCAPDAPNHLASYRDWLAKGYHGSMSYLVRHAELKTDPRQLLPEAKSLVAVALNYNQPNPKRAGSPRIARYALGRDYHRVIRGKLSSLGRWIATRHQGATWRACVDSAPILERDYAQQAGLGWFGKNTILIDSKWGSWFFLGILLTSVEFERDAPAVGGCGSCRKCVEACPTGAIVFEDGRWQVDARRCISYLTIEHRGSFSNEQAAMVGDWTFGCDVCQEVCPFNEARPRQPERAPVTSEPDFLAGRDWPPLERLRVISEEEFDRLTRGSAVRRAGVSGLRRNADANLSDRISQ